MVCNGRIVLAKTQARRDVPAQCVERSGIVEYFERGNGHPAALGFNRRDHVCLAESATIIAGADLRLPGNELTVSSGAGNLVIERLLVSGQGSYRT
jgi:hypothetical protein